MEEVCLNKNCSSSPYLNFSEAKKATCYRRKPPVRFLSSFSPLLLPSGWNFSLEQKHSALLCSLSTLYTRHLASALQNLFALQSSLTLWNANIDLSQKQMEWPAHNALLLLANVDIMTRKVHKLELEKQQLSSVPNTTTSHPLPDFAMIPFAVIIRFISTTAQLGSYHRCHWITDIKNDTSYFSLTGLILTENTSVCFVLLSNFTAAPERELVSWFSGLCSLSRRFLFQPADVCPSCSTCRICASQWVSQAQGKTVVWTTDSSCRLDFLTGCAFCRGDSASEHEPSQEADVVITNRCTYFDRLNLTELPN